MSKHYDPAVAPEPETWLALDESARLRDVMAFHARSETANGESARVHAVVHVLVETQIASADPAVAGITVARLIRDGLSRHDALHAVGSVAMALLWSSMRALDGTGEAVGTFDVARYARELEAFDAGQWQARWRESVE